MEDLSSISDNHSSPEMPHPTVLSRKKTHSVQEIRNSSLYRSEENLPVLQESAREQELRRSLGTIERTSSCIDLAVDYERHPEMKRYVSEEEYIGDVCIMCSPLASVLRSLVYVSSLPAVPAGLYSRDSGEPPLLPCGH